MKKTVTRMLSLALASFAMAQAAERTNVLLIMPDDVSFGDYSFYNAAGPRTPR